MNVSNLLGISESLELLSKLKDTVCLFASREEKLKAEFRGRLAAETKSYEGDTEREAAQLAERLDQAEADREQGKKTIQQHYEHGQERTRQAYKNSLKSTLEKVEQEEGRRKYQLQRSTMETERGHEAGLAAVNNRLKDFQERLLESQQAFEQREMEARKAFRGYPSYQRLLSDTQAGPEPDASVDEDEMLGQLHRLQSTCHEHLEQFSRLFLPRLFRRLSIKLLVVLLALAHSALFVAPRYLKIAAVPDAAAAGSFAVLLLLTLAAYYYGRRKAAPLASAIASQLAQARQLLELARRKAQSRHEHETTRLEEQFRHNKQSLHQQWQDTLQQAAEMRGGLPPRLQEKEQRISRKSEQRYQEKLRHLEHHYTETIARWRQETVVRQHELAAAHDNRVRQIEAQDQLRWQELEQEWKQAVQPLQSTIQLANASADELFPGWQHPGWARWTPPQDFKNAAKIGQLQVDVDQWTEGLQADRRLTFQPSRFSIPLLLSYPRQGSILFETARAGSEQVVAAMNNLIFRLLSTTPPGKINLTIIDPVGLGQNFAGLTHLADYGDSVLNGRIWTQGSQIEEKLGELNEHMEKVIQMYLRNEYPTIAEYNAQAGVMAEKYHFLVVAGFPVNFNETAARRLLNIVSNGARCGVYTIIHWDQRYALPHEFPPEELRKNCVGIVETSQGLALRDWKGPGIRLSLDLPPDPNFATNFLHTIGQSSLEAARVEVPFTDIVPPEKEIWSRDTTEEVRVPIGRSGATNLQELALGKGTRQHALIVGKTGSGKSTLFHIIITNLALWCSPEQIEFYLVDFKKGVEFKRYASHRLPQARVVAIESDREFGLSVLQRVDEELRRRGDLFRRLGAQDLPGYKRAGGTEPAPRSLLIIDEFQEFFVEEDRISQNAALLLDRIVRQGRAFGIHVLLGSQTLGGAYTLARATLGQMVVRIALQCNEADALLIMDESNIAPRLLSRPGEGIYNDAAGALEGNSPFQTAWLSDEMRDTFLARIRQQSDRSSKAYPGPMVFEGNAPADVRDNQNLRKALETDPPPDLGLPRLWLGAPNSIKGPTEAVFPRQSGSHLLVVGQSEESILALWSISLVSLAAQYPLTGARFILFDSSVPGSPQSEYLDTVLQAIPHPVRRPRPSELGEVLTQLAGELETGRSGELAQDKPETFLFVQGLQHFRKLRQEDDFSLAMSENGPQASALLATLITEGPSQGLHLVASCDTYNNVMRFLGRKALSEISLRLLFQMSANDSASLIDSPDASALGLHRALLYNDQEGYQEIFRPYALPENSWLEDVSRILRRRTASARAVSPS